MEPFNRFLYNTFYSLINKRWLLLGFLAFLLALFLNVSISKANIAPKMNCNNVNLAIEFLTKKFKEQMIFRGISAKGHVTMIYLNVDTGTWTATIIQPTDTSVMCSVDLGTNGQKRLAGDSAANKLLETPKSYSKIK